MKAPQTGIAKMPPHVIARNEAHRSCAEGVMLRYSKHEGNGLSAPILREPQDDSALFITPTVIARNEANISCAEGVMLRYSKHEGNGLCALILREPQDDSALLSKVLLMTLVCLFVSVATYAQKKDTIRTDTTKSFVIVDASPISKRDAKPLIILNGKIYKRNIKTIDSAKIKSIEILKGKDAAQYGSKGKNGVIIITTKQ